MFKQSFKYKSLYRRNKLGIIYNIHRYVRHINHQGAEDQFF